MKKLFLILSAVILFSAVGPDRNVQAQGLNISINLGVQPAWGPVGYDFAAFYYIPALNVYFDVNNGWFIFMQNGRWFYDRFLPRRYARYDLYSLFKVVINEPYPWLNNNRHRRQFAQFRGRNHNQIPIRNSRDARYSDSRRNEVRWINPDRSYYNTQRGSSAANYNSQHNRPNNNTQGGNVNNSNRPNNNTQGGNVNNSNRPNNNTQGSNVNNSNRPNNNTQGSGSNTRPSGSASDRDKDKVNNNAQGNSSQKSDSRPANNSQSSSKEKNNNSEKAKESKTTSGRSSSGRSGTQNTTSKDNDRDSSRSSGNSGRSNSGQRNR